MCPAGHGPTDVWFTARVEFPLLAVLPTELQDRVLATARRRRFEKREVVVHEGDVADTLHLVASGRLAAHVSTPNGQVATLNVIKAGGYFGEISLLERGKPRRTATIVALEPTETLSISRSAFQKLRETYPAVQHLLTMALAESVDRLSQRLLEVMYDGLDRRVYRQLLVLGDVYADPASSNEVTIPLTQEVLAEFVGSARPSVNVILKKLEDQGLLRIERGRITILDRRTLAARLH